MITGAFFSISWEKLNIFCLKLFLNLPRLLHQQWSVSLCMCACLYCPCLSFFLKPRLADDLQRSAYCCLPSDFQFLVHWHQLSWDKLGILQTQVSLCYILLLNLIMFSHICNMGDTRTQQRPSSDSQTVWWWWGGNLSSVLVWCTRQAGRVLCCPARVQVSVRGFKY